MSATGDDPFRVMFVCTGNICRSPMAEVVFRRLAEQAGLGHRIISSSAGTGDWHVGEQADYRTLTTLARQGYDGTAHRAKQFDAAAFEINDLVVALDRSHARILRSWSLDDAQADKIVLLLDFDPSSGETLDVPDPYYADTEMFDTALAMIESACRSLFRQLEPAIRPSAARPGGSP